MATPQTTRANPSRQPGPNNANWKGGRVVASNGYILVKVGKDHPMADVRGYAYEHRLVAAKMLGRSLEPGEEVHHRDRNKQNNAPDNLEIVNDALHGIRHRGEGSRLRLPGEENPTVNCACGCGGTFYRFDDNGRPREYMSGHNPPATPTQDAVLAALSPDQPRSRAAIAESSGVGPLAVMQKFTESSHRGQAEHARNFWTALTSHSRREAPEPS
jgi:hypothetical protein